MPLAHYKNTDITLVNFRQKSSFPILKIEEFKDIIMLIFLRRIC
jgi:hypothetical protein